MRKINRMMDKMVYTVREKSREANELRKLYLVDGTGRERSLQSNVEFMWEPSGLGFAENREYAPKLEYGFSLNPQKISSNRK